MNLVNSLAVVIGIMGGIATWVALSTTGTLNLQIWAIFIAWACFYHCGGGMDGLKSGLAGNIWGLIMATVALTVAGTGVGAMVGVPVVVGVTVLILILGANIGMLSSIPAGVYGYAAGAAFGLMTQADPAVFTLTGNGLLLPMALSMVVGAVLGLISEKVAGSLTS